MSDGYDNLDLETEPLASWVDESRNGSQIGCVETTSVTCPSCFEVFEVALPPADECPCEVDYDCEVCCRPMIISFSENMADARSLND
ncbi:MAG: hypothetical protein H7A51_14010 [Akkermansiaceae bacterium]|nr:hypothetical protein [Akkermansiaceae bacterium]